MNDYYEKNPHDITVFFTTVLFSQPEKRKTHKSINSPLSDNKITSATTDHESNVFLGIHEGIVVVETLIMQKMLEGKHQFIYNTDSLQTGSYLCKFKTEKLSNTKKQFIMK